MEVSKRAYEGVGWLLAVLILVIHNAFEPQAGEVLEHEVVVLGDAAERMKTDGEFIKLLHNYNHSRVDQKPQFPVSIPEVRKPP